MRPLAVNLPRFAAGWKRPCSLRPWPFVLAVIGLVPVWAGEGTDLVIAGPTAAPTRLVMGGVAVPLQAGGGFSVVDVGGNAPVVLGNEVISREGGTWRYSAAGDELKLQATFETRGTCIVVAGEVESLRADDRAIALRFTLPVPGAGAVFSNGLSEATTISAERGSELGTVFPLAAMVGTDWGAALAIPPDFPCCFGVSGNRDGLAVEFYLGLSPEVRRFPRRAAFRFVIDRAEPGWGFRSALAQYYERHAAYYRPRYEGAGFWNWNDPAGLDDADSIVNAALPFYKVHGLTRGSNYDRQVERDRRFGVVPVAYTIVGMRELTGLKDMPGGYDQAMKVFADFETAWQAEGPDGPMYKQHAANSERNHELPSQIRTSTMFDAEGRYRLRTRHTVWGANSVTFIQNPNPDLFSDRQVPTTGSVTLAMLRRWLAEPQVDGVHLDSLGSQWPNWLNYRREHYAYARYPLTFDQRGQVALHNRVSHYEFVEDARALALQHGKLLFGNGIDTYVTRNRTEQYNTVNHGRFFLAALLDMAGREITDDVLTRPRLEAYRVMLGPKLMTAILYKWKDEPTVRRQMNRGLVFDIFTSPNRFFEDKISYLAAPNGFARDRELLTWFSRHARTLHDARWQPVTHARVDQPEVACERYGTGDVVYFALVNLGTAAVDCTMQVDMAALGLAPGDGISSTYSEVARGGSLAVQTAGATGHVRLRLAPDEAHIVKLVRTW
jgi:hypothetical protein